jgi:hypothetical protein
MIVAARLPYFKNRCYLAVIQAIVVPKRGTLWVLISRRADKKDLAAK